mgnify:CR=1 FL=1
MWDAVFLFLVLLGSLVLTEPWLLRQIHEPEWSTWLLEHALLPLARSACVLAFIVLAYPDIFGLEQAPPIQSILGVPGRWTDLLNLGFVLSMALPLLPHVERIPGVVLPIQGFVTLALIFRWMTEGPVHLWPSSAAWLAAGVAALAPIIAEWVAPVRQPEHDRIRDAVLIPLQLPPLILYGQALGAQISG